MTSCTSECLERAALHRQTSECDAGMKRDVRVRGELRQEGLDLKLVALHEVKLPLPVEVEVTPVERLVVRIADAIACCACGQSVRDGPGASGLHMQRTRLRHSRAGRRRRWHGCRRIGRRHRRATPRCKRQNSTAMCEGHMHSPSGFSGFKSMPKRRRSSFGEPQWGPAICRFGIC